MFILLYTSLEPLCRVPEVHATPDIRNDPSLYLLSDPEILAVELISYLAGYQEYPNIMVSRLSTTYKNHVPRKEP